MKKSYVPKTLTEYLTESKTIPLKRKYGERPAVIVGVNAPLRNQVLSFVAESGSVSKRDLKQYIMGLKEGGSTVAAANMFIKRNAKYFLSESKNGVTYFKLSNLGKRLVNQFVGVENQNVSESVKNARRTLSKLLESARTKRKLNEDDEMSEMPEETEEFEVPDDAVEDSEMAADDFDDEGPADEVEFERDSLDDEDESDEDHVSTDEFEYEEDDEKIVLTYYKNANEGDELEDDELEDDELEDRPEEDETREFDFKDKGRPGILGMDESTQAQFVTHNLAGKKKSKLAGRYSTGEYHNLLDDNEEKDEQELKNHLIRSKKNGKLDEEKAIKTKLAGRYSTAKYHNLLDDDQEKDEQELKNLEKEITEANNLGGKLSKSFHNLLANDQNSDPNEDELNINEHDSRVLKMKQIIENLKAKRKSILLEDEEATEQDELKDEDLDSLNLDDEVDENPEEDLEVSDEDEVEKVEITEFIITVDDVDSAIEELEELGVTAERVPIEKPEEEEDITAEIEEEPTENAEETENGEADLGLGIEDEKAEAQKESFRKFVAGILNEAEDAETDQTPDELGTSDELGLGDQGEDAKELEDAEREETIEPTAEFEENKIKVNAEDWETLKGWLEEKGVDVKEMFGGDIETEEFDNEEDAEIDVETEVEPAEISDDDIDFSGIADDDETKINDEKRR